LATVKGDVHDIGKNLVDIILSNNGYEVKDLGIKVPPSQLIEAIKQENPDMVGLSGLLVKSAQQMVVTARDMKQAGIDIPILVGGAALSRKFTETKIAPEYDGLVLYAKDAMQGLALADRLQNPEERQKLQEEKVKRSREAVRDNKTTKNQTVAVNNKGKSNINRNVPVFVPKDTKRHLLRNYSLAHVEPYINKQMLLGRHLGVKGKVEKLLQEKDEKTVKVYEMVKNLMAEAERNGWITPQAVYQFFPAQSSGNTIFIYDPDEPGKVMETFEFPRQNSGSFLCLADYIKPVDSGEIDYVGFFAVTAGTGVKKAAEQLKNEGRFVESHALLALALETAEGLAELVHRHMRDAWGFPDR